MLEFVGREVNLTISKDLEPLLDVDGILEFREGCGYRVVIKVKGHTYGIIWLSKDAKATEVAEEVRISDSFWGVE